MFEEGDMVDVTGISKGKGYQRYYQRDIEQLVVV